MKTSSSPIVAALFLALALVAGAQNRGGVIEGQLRLPDGAPAAGVRVGAKAVDQPGVESLFGLVETGADGRYRLEDLPAGRYYIVAGPVGAPIYHPGLDTPEGATIVTVAGVRLNGFNFTVDPVRLIAPPSGPLRNSNINAPGPGICFSGVPPTRAGILLLAADRAGNVFFAEDNASSVSKLTPDGKVSTVAGNGVRGFSGDGGRATAASLGPVRALAADPAGNLFIGEAGSPRIRKVTPAGIITTVAGNGTLAVSGDGGAATSAAMCTPTGLAVDGAGNLFIATGMGVNSIDNFDHWVRDDYRVRKVDAAGIIRTVAGNGAGGDGFAPDGVPATSAAMFPMSITADAAGNLYIVITREMIRKVSPDGTITTFAGSDSASVTSADGVPALSGRVFVYDANMATDTRGNLFITDDNRIRKINSSGIIATIAGTGQRATDDRDGVPATSSTLNLPQSAPSLPKASASIMAADGAGNLFVAERQNTGGEIVKRIRKITPDGTISTAFKFVSQLPCSDAQLPNARPANRMFLAADRAGNVFFADDSSALVRKVSPDGTLSAIAGNGSQGFSGDGGPATSASLGAVTALAADPSGNVFIAEAGSPRVRKVTLAGTIVTIAGNGKREFSGDGGPAIAASMCDPTGLSADAGGNVFIASGVGPTGPGSGSGVLAADNYRIRRVDAAGVITTVAGTGAVRGRVDLAVNDGRATDRLIWARSIAADAGNLYILDDWGLGRVNPAGQLAALARRDIAGRAGTASADLAADGKGNLFIADSVSNRIQKLGADGSIVTVAGNGQRGMGYGEGMMATTVSLSLQMSTVATGSAIAGDGLGNLFIGEIGNAAGQINRRIRKVAPDGTISTVFSSTPSFRISAQVVSAVSPSAHATRAFGGAPVPAAPEAQLYLIALNSAGSPTPPAQTPGRVSLDSPGAGRFGLFLPEGSYELFAAVPDINGWDLAAPGRDGGARPVAFGRTSIVGNANQTGITVRAHPGVDLKGRVTLDGQPVSPNGLRIRLQPDAAASTLAQYQAVGRFSPAIGADGSFTFPALPEAQYQIELQWTGAANYAVKAVLLDGANVVDTGITIGAAAPGSLEIVLVTTP